MLRIRGLHKRFGERVVLDAIDAEAKEGAIVAILGPSGCGKSTLLRCMNGLESFEQGSIQIGGVELAAGPSHPRAVLHRLGSAVGTVFQDLHLFPHLTALENVSLAPRVVSRIPAHEADERGRALLELVGLGDRALARPNELSGGQRQRVAIARSLAQGARVLLMDEPTSALDSKLRSEVALLLRNLASEKPVGQGDQSRLTLVMVTHDAALAAETGASTWTLREGRLQVES